MTETRTPTSSPAADHIQPAPKFGGIPPITAADVRRRRDETGRSMQDCQRALERERLAKAIDHVRCTQEWDLLADILHKLNV